MTTKKRPSEAKVRQELRRLGSRRQRQRDAEEKLHADTVKALKDAEGVVPTTEAAELIGLNRSTVYEVYRGGREKRKAAAR
jgi:DNA invertase Pin-like site-specific DNA recombinase